MTDERFERDEGDALDARLRVLAQSYHAPPETPREAMWEAIARERAARGGAAVLPFPARRRWGRWMGLAAAAAALVVAGAVMERLWQASQSAERKMAAESGPRTPAAAGRATTGPNRTLQYAAAEHLAKVEALLVRARSVEDPGASARVASDAEVARWARDLLGTTRLLLDSKAAEDARLRPLLEDLELALARIVQRQAAGEDAREVIDDVIARQGMLDRLRAAVPAGPAPAGS